MTLPLNYRNQSTDNLTGDEVDENWRTVDGKITGIDGEIAALDQRVTAVETRPSGGGGATRFVDLTDKADADIPAINLPTGQALDKKLNTTHAGTGGAAHATAVAGGAAGFMSGGDKAKLDALGGAGSGTPDAVLLDRVNHTGVQPSSTISDFAEAAQDIVGGMVAAAGGAYNDTAGTISLGTADAVLLSRANHTGTQPAATISDFGEAAQDVVGAMIVAAGGTYNDPAGTITLPGGGAPDSFLLARANHTGTQIAATISDFSEASQDVIGAMIAAAGGSYNDTAGTITLPASSGGGALPPVNLGTGAINLTASANANRANRWNGTNPQTVAINTTGGVIGDLYSIANNGTAALTMPGTAATGFKLTIEPGTVGVIEWQGGTSFLSLIPAASSGGGALAPVDLGTGAIALTAAAHANRALRWSGSAAQTVSINTTGGVIGDLYSIANKGTATITMPGSAAAGFKLAVEPGTVGAIEWEGGPTFYSTIPAQVTGGGGGEDPASISAPSGTAVGSPLVVAFNGGWFANALQWEANGVAIPGETSATLLIPTADVWYRCIVNNQFATNQIHSTAAGGGGGTLSVVTVASYPGHNLDTAGYLGWMFQRLSDTTVADKSMYAGAYLEWLVASGGAVRVNGTANGAGFDWNGTAQDGPSSPASGVNDTACYQATTAPGVLTMHVGAGPGGGGSPREFTFLLGAFDNQTSAPQLTFDFDDNSITPQTFSVPIAYFTETIQWTVYRATFSVADPVRLRVRLALNPSTPAVYPKIWTLK
jgi:hypothetical protein